MSTVTATQADVLRDIAHLLDAIPGGLPALSVFVSPTGRVDLGVHVDTDADALAVVDRVAALTASTPSWRPRGIDDLREYGAEGRWCGHEVYIYTLLPAAEVPS
jgi:hypothetical protein